MISEGDAILSGYLGAGSYDPEQLRWCEVLNYLHFACWSRPTGGEYESFALDRAESAVCADP
ncbi:MAG: hypothetical protein QNK04_10895 [Myxococcota bacterium]|nr:hypothetical protein [Myxococcota bacterium]